MTNSSNSDGILSRRSFILGVAALGALIPASSLLAACSSSGQAPATDAAEGDNASATDDAGAATDSAAAENDDATQGAATAGSVLVVYFSAQGHTERVAQAISDALDADLFAITPVDPCTDDDLNYNDDESRASVEHTDANRHVELEAVTPEGFADYDTVFVGYPIWWGDASWVVDDFVSGNDFAGKTVIPFCTSASSPIGDSGELLAALAGSGEWQEGRRFASSASEEEIAEWATGLFA